MADARVKVQVDTRQAKADLRQLHRDKTKVAKRVAGASRRVLTRAAAFTGAAATVGRFNSPPPAGNVDPLDEALTPIYAKLKQEADHAVGFSASARRVARERTRAAFAYHVGRTGSMVEARRFYDLADKSAQDAAAGRLLIRQDPRFLGPDLTDVVPAMLAGHTELFLRNLYAINPLRILARGFEYVVNRLRS